MIRALTSSLLLLTLVVTAGCGERSEGVLTAIITSSNEHGTYRARGEGIGSVRGEGQGIEYELYTMYRMDSMDFNGTGSFQQLPQGVQQYPTEHKPGDPTDGIDILYCFYQTPDGKYIIRQIMEGITPGGDIGIDVMAEVEFTEGTWEDYLAGDTVTVMFTEAGLEEYYSVATEQAEQLVQVLGQSQDPNLRLDFDFEWQNQPNCAFEVSLEELTYKLQGDSKLKMRMEAFK